MKLHGIIYSVKSATPLDLRNHAAGFYASSAQSLGGPKVLGNTSKILFRSRIPLLILSLVAAACSQDGAEAAARGTELVACAGDERAEVDVNGDGAIDVREFYRKGKRVCVQSDLNFDGQWDVERFYDGSGVVVAHERFDFDFDGRIDQRSYYENGRLVRIELDTNFDDAVDTWLWCTQGWVARAERDRHSDGAVDVWEDYNDGLIVEARYDEDRDGLPERWELFRDGRLVLVKYDDNADGQPDRTDEIPVQSIGAADDALRCEAKAAAEAKPSQPGDLTSTGSERMTNGEP